MSTLPVLQGRGYLEWHVGCVLAMLSLQLQGLKRGQATLPEGKQPGWLTPIYNLYPKGKPLESAYTVPKCYVKDASLHVSADLRASHLLAARPALCFHTHLFGLIGSVMKAGRRVSIMKSGLCLFQSDSLHRKAHLAETYGEFSKCVWALILMQAVSLVTCTFFTFSGLTCYGWNSNASGHDRKKCYIVWHFNFLLAE